MLRRSPAQSQSNMQQPTDTTPLLAKPAQAPSAPESNTIRFDELADWRRDNSSILSLYRREMPSYRACAWSVVGYLHNETTNSECPLACRSDCMRLLGRQSVCDCDCDGAS